MSLEESYKRLLVIATGTQKLSACRWRDQDIAYIIKRIKSGVRYLFVAGTTIRDYAVCGEEALREAVRLRLDVVLCIDGECYLFTLSNLLQASKEQTVYKNEFVFKVVLTDGKKLIDVLNRNKLTTMQKELDLIYVGAEKLRGRV